MLRRSFLGPVERLVLIRDGFYSPDAGCRRRAAVLLALDRGSTLTGAARSARCNRGTVYRWLGNYLEQRDVAALGDGRRRYTGRPRSLQRDLAARAEALDALIAAELAADPARPRPPAGSVSTVRPARP